MKHLVSVEHDVNWFNAITKKIEENGIRNVDYFFEPDISKGSDSDYVRVVERVGHGLDFALVDGVLRDHCALSVLPLLKRNAVLIIDNANWFLPCCSRSPNSRTHSDGFATPHWALFQEEVRNWKCIWTSSGVTDTAFWFKP